MMFIGNLEFAWPWLGLLLPLPWVMRLFLPAGSDRSAVLHVPFVTEFDAAVGDRRPYRPSWFLFVLAVCAWLLLVLAATRPLHLGPEQALPVSGRDLMLAVDLSRSMRERDMLLSHGAVNRLEVIKAIAGEFISRRRGDRIGLILFGEKPYLQSPMTFDRETVLTLLQEAQIGLLGNKTAIGDAIGLAIKQLRVTGDDADAAGAGTAGSEYDDATYSDRVLILLTDGSNTAGNVAPVEAADYAADIGLRVYTIGIGSERRRRTDLDEQTLTQIAEKTGGSYFRARNSSELLNIYREIDRLEPRAEERGGFRQKHELFYWPLAGALLLSVLAGLWFWLSGPVGPFGHWAGALKKYRGALSWKP